MTIAIVASRSAASHSIPTWRRITAFASISVSASSRSSIPTAPIRMMARSIRECSAASSVARSSASSALDARPVRWRITASRSASTPPSTFISTHARADDPSCLTRPMRRCSVPT